jgi:hypothetical protein
VTLGCAWPVIEAALTRSTAIDAPTDEAHHEVQHAVSAHTFDCRTSTPRTHMLSAAPFLC